MPRINVMLQLHLWLMIDDGKYPTGTPDADLEIETPDSPANLQKLPARERRQLGSMPTWTRISITKEIPDTDDQDARDLLKTQLINQLLVRTNRLIRCYRAITRDERFVELTRASASPFLFRML